jgi:hypothetical protein
LHLDEPFRSIVRVTEIISIVKILIPMTSGIGLTYLGLVGSFFEIGVLFVSLFLIFQQKGHTLVEAGAYAGFTTLMALTCLLRVAFIVGVPSVTLLAEIPVAICAVIFIWRRRSELALIRTGFTAILRNNRWMAVFFCVGFGYLLAQTVLLPPARPHWDALAPVLWLDRYVTEGWGASGIQLPDLASQHTLLTYLVLRWQVDFGTGIFGLLAYVTIGFTTYALARRYAWPPTAFTVTLITLSFPRLVLNSTSPGGEVIVAAGAVFCILAVYRLVERPHILDLLILVLAACFTGSDAGAPWFFCGILVLLCLVLFFRRHGGGVWLSMIRQNIRLVLLVSLPAVLLSPLWWRVFYGFHGSGADFPVYNWSGMANPEPLVGTLGNGLRYLFESLDLTHPVDVVCSGLAGFSPRRALLALYETAVAPLLGLRGAQAPFGLVWLQDETHSWFGPLAFFLILPALGYALWRGPRRLKAVAVALCGYFYLVCLVLAWRPGNARYFSIFFACSGFFVAFLMPPWRLTRRGKKLLQAFSVLIFVYACSGHMDRPLIPGGFHQAGWIETGNIWTKTNWGKNRLAVAADLFGDDRIGHIIESIKPGERVGLAAPTLALTYPFLMQRADVSFIPFRQEYNITEKIERFGLDRMIFLEPGGGMKMHISLPQALPKQ